MASNFINMNIMHDHSPRTPKAEWPMFAHYERRISNAKDITAETLSYFNQQGNKSVMIKFILSLPPINVHQRW
ncbi:unnamed protein product [Blepharisma stoltei]|uniref:Uncharacterized protein n=1 Tax=Blepharisma stoltei TaxID=1481888 RepID=A0AAU9JC22_9CILI|nr:unnamed protein product [Blepharisma stoltei]